MLKYLIVFVLIGSLFVNIYLYAENYTFKLRPDIITYLQYKSSGYHTYEFGYYRKDFKETVTIYPTIGKNNLNIVIFDKSTVYLKDIGNWNIKITSTRPMFINYQIKDETTKYIQKTEIVFKYNPKRNQIEVVL